MVVQHSMNGSLHSTGERFILLSRKLSKKHERIFLMIKPISEKISEFRRARSLTQEKLGEQLGVSSQAVSKWEKGESMPDIMLLPQLCEILGITADALLEVSSLVKKENFMSELTNYSNEVGVVSASFEAVKACTKEVNTELVNGSSIQAYNGIQIFTNSGFALILNGEEKIKQVQQINTQIISTMSSLLSDENVLKVISCLDFSIGISDKEIMSKTNLSETEVTDVIYKLLKQGFCECDIDGKHIFGDKAFALFAVLGGMYIASNDGYKEINSRIRNYPPRYAVVKK